MPLKQVTELEEKARDLDRKRLERIEKSKMELKYERRVLAESVKQETKNQIKKYESQFFERLKIVFLLCLIFFSSVKFQEMKTSVNVLLFRFLW